jgi:hypothetical protein
MADGSLLSWEDSGSVGAGNVVYQPAGGGAQRVVASTSAVEIQGSASPDGRYVAYTSDSTGEPEVYVQPFPPTGAKWLVQSGVGTPVWSADGRELFVVKGRQLLAVPVSTEGAFHAGTPRKLFDVPAATVLADDTTTVFAVAPDGRAQPADRWTDVVITPERGVSLVDGLLTGWHEPEASHLLMLEGVAGRDLVARSYEAGLALGYRWHEFGDSHLLLP